MPAPMLRGSPSRISTIVYSSLSLLAIAAASNAKGYVDTVGEFTFVLLVSAAGIAIAHFWSALLAHRLLDPSTVTVAFLRREAVGSSVIFLPAILMTAVAALGWVVNDEVDRSVTIAMVTLVVALFGLTWAGGVRRDEGWLPALGWAGGTALVGILMIVFKLVA